MINDNIALMWRHCNVDDKICHSKTIFINQIRKANGWKLRIHILRPHFLRRKIFKPVFEQRTNASVFIINVYYHSRYRGTIASWCFTRWVCGFVCRDVCLDGLTMKNWRHTNNTLQEYSWGRPVACSPISLHFRARASVVQLCKLCATHSWCHRWRH